MCSDVLEFNYTQNQYQFQFLSLKQSDHFFNFPISGPLHTGWSLAMALVVYWYDFICFGIVVAAYIGSLWILWRKEGASRCDDNTIYESLLAAQADGDGFVRATHKAHVGSNQLWSSCWKRVHPGCLLLTRFLSFVAMAVFLSWDILDWDASIFIYYTE